MHHSAKREVANNLFHGVRSEHPIFNDITYFTIVHVIIPTDWVIHVTERFEAFEITSLDKVDHFISSKSLIIGFILLATKLALLLLCSKCANIMSLGNML